MRPPRVVNRKPALGLRADVVERAEKVRVQDFLAIAPVEALDVGIQAGLPRLDVPQMHAVTPAPGGEFVGYEFGPIVAAERARCAVQRDELIQHLGHRSAGSESATLTASASRFPSSKTLSVWKRVPP